jgi:spore coat protein CotF
MYDFQFKQVCAKVCNKISKYGIKKDRYFVDEVETQLREKLLRGSQTKDINYLKDKTSYKVVTLT